MSLRGWWTRVTNISLCYLSYACLVNVDDLKEGPVKGIKGYHTFSGRLWVLWCCVCSNIATLFPDSQTQSQEQLKVHDVAWGHSCRIFLFALNSSSFLAVGDYVTVTMLLLLPPEYRLFRPPLELIDQGWHCTSCGTWHVVRVALTSNQGREKSLLSSWAEEAVVNPSGDCWSIISYKAALINICSVSTKPEVGCSVRRWFSSCLNITQHHLKHTAGVVSSLRWECVVFSRCLRSWRELKPHTHPDHEKLARTICFR